LTEELIKQLLEAGVHFGHQTKRWNPKMAPFIFGARSSIYIIDLEKTAERLQQARDFLKKKAREGEVILFVGTKKQAQDIITEAAKTCGMYYVSHRWLGGLLTNFSTIKKSIARLKDIEKMKEDGRAASFTKKEVSLFLKEKEKLEKNLGGIKDMERLPGALFVVDSRKEELAVREARKLGIPVVALIDTNSDPDMVDYPIPGNDDAIKSIRLITCLIAESIAGGRKEFLEYLARVNIKPQVQELTVPLEVVAMQPSEAQEKEESAELAEKVVEVGSDEEGFKRPSRVKPLEACADTRLRKRNKR
jgi:small subunit ribosomal protein S2